VGVAEELEVEQVGVAEELEVVLEREVLGQVVAAGLEPALVRLQGQALARVQAPRSVLDRMHP
jgi:hypothetical protein